MPRSDHAEIHIRSGTLLIGSRANPDVAYWQKALHQGHLPPLVIGKLQQGGHVAATHMRQLAERLGLISHLARKPDAEIFRLILEAVEARKASAVFLPNNLVHLRPDILLSKTVPSSQTPASSSTVTPVGAPTSAVRLDVARMTSIQRIKEMLKRVPSYLGDKINLKQAFLALLSPESLEALAASLALLIAAQAVGIGEIVDAGLAGLAYYQVGLPGLWALLDLIIAVKKAAAAQTESEIDEAAALFAGAVIVVGILVLVVGIMHRGRANGGRVADKEVTTKESIISKGKSYLNKTKETINEKIKISPIKTPYGDAIQSESVEAMAARARVENGAPLYRIGTTGKSNVGEAQFWSLEHPSTPGFAEKHGIPPENVNDANFFTVARLKPGTPFVTRPSPGVGTNAGGAIEVVVPENGVRLSNFVSR